STGSADGFVFLLATDHAGTNPRDRRPHGRLCPATGVRRPTRPSLNRKLRLARSRADRFQRRLEHPCPFRAVLPPSFPPERAGWPIPLVAGNLADLRRELA